MFLLFYYYLQWTNEVWGLAVFPNDTNKIVTCSDDGTVRIWSKEERRLLGVSRTLLTSSNLIGFLIKNDRLE
jgi:WD40 repeat protein